MNIELTTNNKNLELLRELFTNMTQKITNDEIRQVVSTGSFEDLYRLVARFNNPVYRKEVVFAHLINVLAQTSLTRVSSLLDQAVASSCIGLYGLQIKSRIASVASKCFISYCTIENLMLRYKNFEHIRTYVEIKHSDINVLRVALETPTYPVQDQDKITANQIHKWLNSHNVKVNELQIVFK